MKKQDIIELKKQDLPYQGEIFGWIDTIRHHGGVIFIVLRDRTAKVQVVIDPQSVNVDQSLLKNEAVLKVKGVLQERPEGTINTDDLLGYCEFHSQAVEILSKTSPLPFQLDEHQQLSEEVRLKYRYLDLRRTEVQNKFITRSQVIHKMRNFLHAQSFIECETPILTKPTPEGARDYLVPSRLHPKKSFALPQSPQLFKQLLMASGFEKYYQVARCFRDEDLRSDRQPEFTQLDIEMSFVDQEDIMELTENLVSTAFEQVLSVKLPKVKTLTYQKALELYGSDKPDLRSSIHFHELSPILSNCDFKVFKEPSCDPNSRVAAMVLPGLSKLTRKEIDNYTDFVRSKGSQGMAYMKVESLDPIKLASPITKFLSEDIINALVEKLSPKVGDLIVFGAGKSDVVNKSFSALRDKVIADHNFYECSWAPLWVVDFPMFEYCDQEKRYFAMHHPFTAPMSLEGEPNTWLSKGYDFVLNGYEVAGGSVRIHQEEIQRKVLDLLGIDDEEAHDKFGFLLEAQKYGFPPHAGIAFGLDRLVMLMTESDSIRDVILFPKTQSAFCPLTQAPGSVTSNQIQELHLNFKESES